MKFERIAWSEEAAVKLRRAMKYAEDAEYIRGEVSNGVARLWRLADGAAYMVTRAEGNELVIVCFEGERLREAAPYIIAAAQRGGFQSIRWHTQNPALNRLLHFLNPEPIEYVVRIPVYGQQIEKLDYSKPNDYQRPRH